MIKFLIVALFINIAYVFCGSIKGCPKLPAAAVDESFIKGNFILTRHADTEVYRKRDRKFEFIGKPANMKSMCWDSIGVLDDGSPYRAKIKCSYEKVSQQYCSLEKEDIEKFPDSKGTVVFTSTDNSTYITGVTCISAKGSFWWIATSKGDSVDPGVEKTAFEIFEKAGLDTKKEATKDSVLVIKEFNFSNEDECN